VSEAQVFTKKTTTKKNYTLLPSLFDLLGTTGVTSTTAFFILTLLLFAGGVSC